jgi:hypothetical protein
MNGLVKNEGGAWAPKTFDDARVFAEMVSKTDFVPKNYRNKPNDCLMAMTFGNEIGLGVMAALQNIAVINGKPSIYGDVALALVKAHPSYESIKEEFDPDAKRCTCTVKRKGDNPVTGSFSMAEASHAGLLEKAGPWKTYPRRMLQMRARAWALRDAFPDVLNGIAVGEEAQDIPMENVTPKEKPAHREEEAEEVGGTVEDQPEDDLSKLMDDLTDSLNRAEKSGLISKEEKAAAIEKAYGMSSKVVLEKFVVRVGQRLADESVDKEQKA